MIALVPDLRRPILEPPERNPLPFQPRPAPGGLAARFDLMGTAHFTRRSVVDAIGAASSGYYSSLALELDRARFAQLDEGSLAVHPRQRQMAEGEFVAASDALGNREGDIWLIDMSMGEISERLAARLDGRQAAQWDYVSRRLAPYELEGLRQWEAGREDEAMSYLDVTVQVMKEYAPSLHKVLIEERNLLMAARLAEVAARTEGRTLVLVGKAHVEGIGRLLADPVSIRKGFRSYHLEYTPPTRIRRVRVS